MTIAIHQPNYLPWLGYFYKIHACDVFVFLDSVEFSKGSYTKRCKIRIESTSSQTTWLSVPVQSHHKGTRIADIRIVEDSGWIHRHLNKIENTYRGTPNFTKYYDWLRETILGAQLESTLAGCNMRLIREVAARLDLQTRFYRSSEMPVSGKGSELNLEIARSLAATHYLGGKGSKKYQEDDAFHKASIATRIHDIGEWEREHPYDQGTEQFTGGLSIIDALMHIGEDGILKLFESFEKSG